MDLNFELRSDRLLARAKRRLITMRDTHDVELMTQDSADECLAVIMTMIMLLENRDEAAARARDDG